MSRTVYLPDGSVHEETGARTVYVGLEVHQETEPSFTYFPLSQPDVGGLLRKADMVGY